MFDVVNSKNNKVEATADTFAEAQEIMQLLYKVAENNEGPFQEFPHYVILDKVEKF